MFVCLHVCMFVCLFCFLFLSIRCNIHFYPQIIRFFSVVSAVFRASDDKTILSIGHRDRLANALIPCLYFLPSTEPEQLGTDGSSQQLHVDLTRFSAHRHSLLGNGKQTDESEVRKSKLSADFSNASPVLAPVHTHTLVPEETSISNHSFARPTSRSHVRHSLSRTQQVSPPPSPPSSSPPPPLSSLVAKHPSPTGPDSSPPHTIAVSTRQSATDRRRLSPVERDYDLDTYEEELGAAEDGGNNAVPENVAGTTATTTTVGAITVPVVAIAAPNAAAAEVRRDSNEEYSGDDDQYDYDALDFEAEAAEEEERPVISSAAEEEDVNSALKVSCIPPITDPEVSAVSAANAYGETIDDKSGSIRALNCSPRLEASQCVNVAVSTARKEEEDPYPFHGNDVRPEVIHGSSAVECERNSNVTAAESLSQRHADCSDAAASYASLPSAVVAIDAADAFGREMRCTAARTLLSCDVLAASAEFSAAAPIAAVVGGVPKHSHVRELDSDEVRGDIDAPTRTLEEERYNNPNDRTNTSNGNETNTTSNTRSISQCEEEALTVLSSPPQATDFIDACATSRLLIDHDDEIKCTSDPLLRASPDEGYTYYTDDFAESGESSRAPSAARELAGDGQSQVPLAGLPVPLVPTVPVDTTPENALRLPVVLLHHGPDVDADVSSTREAAALTARADESVDDYAYDVDELVLED